MDKMLYIAMTGAKNTLVAQDTHSNNLANASTTGFKADFAQARSMPVFGETHPTRVYSMTEQPGVNYESGPMQQTGNPLDVAVKGEGFLTVVDEQGQEALTRAGGLHVDVNGFMRTHTGQIVMGNAGPMIIPPFETIEIGADGGVSIRPLGQGAETIAEIDRMKLVNPALDSIEKGLDGMFRPANGEVLPPAGEVQLQAGFLEGSNVSPVNSLLEILSLSRQFELGFKMMKEVEQMDQATDKLIQAS